MEKFAFWAKTSIYDFSIAAIDLSHASIQISVEACTLTIFLLRSLWQEFPDEGKGRLPQPPLECTTCSARTQSSGSRLLLTSLCRPGAIRACISSRALLCYRSCHSTPDN